MESIIISKELYKQFNTIFLLLVIFSFCPTTIIAQDSTPKPGNPRKHMHVDSKIGIVNHFNKDGKGNNEDFYFSSGSGEWRNRVQFRIHYNGTVSTTNGIHADWGNLYLVADWDNSSSTEDIIFGFDGKSRDKVKEKMRLTDDGRLGIGTDKPKSKLHVNGDIYSKGNIKLFAYEGENKSGIAYIQARDNSNSSNISLQFRTKRGSKIIDAVKLNSLGNVGIGTTNPNEKLHVKGNTISNNVFIGDVGHGSAWAGFAHESQKNKDDYSLISHKDGGHTFLNKKDTGDGYIGFRIGNKDKMILTNNGMIGIGTTSPSEKLDVKGNIKVKDDLIIGQSRLSSATENANTLLTVSGGVKTDKVILNIGSFPDYVFADEYPLMPIEEVAEYVKENKHLPNIPSEKEMVSTGMDMKMMSLKLVEKIEELTLYTIQQQETITEQKEINNQQQSFMISQQELIKKLIERIDRLEKPKN